MNFSNLKVDCNHERKLIFNSGVFILSHYIQGESVMVKDERGGDISSNSVAMEQRNLQRRLFVYDSFIKTDESVTTTQRLFHLQFNLDRHGAVFSRNTILTLVETLLVNTLHNG